MDQILYDLMDWAAIEELVYSEAAEPQKLLGAHVVDEGILIQVFIPTATAVTVIASGKKYPMEMEDENGFFAALIPGKTKKKYRLKVTFDDGTTEEMYDPYAFDTQFTDGDFKKFEAGIHYDIYNKMGAHKAVIDGVEGVNFAVWAPNAMRVSVVGNFNLWDGRRHQMMRRGDSGIFELFIPGMAQGDIYKYEVKFRNGDPSLKADPYGNYSEIRPNTASVVWDINGFKWTDDSWMKNREKADDKKAPMSIYELHLGSWIRKEVEKDADGTEIFGTEFYNYREIAKKLAEYVKEMGYTHIELMPVMEHPLDASWGYQVTGYYAPTSRYGTPDDFMYFMDYMHNQGIGVILDWVPAHFPRDTFGLASFDGTALYEHSDPRQGAHPHWGTLIYNYGSPQVSNFLIANALFWAEKYHADGIRMDAVASMLYLDYGKNAGEWIPNIYGGNENLEAVEFLKHLNSIFKEKEKGAVLIAEESTAWPQITGDVKDGALGFDYKWNMGWMNDFTGYMQYDPYFRCHHYGELTFSMLYAYSENFVLVFSHDEVVHGKASMIGKMPGSTQEEKASNLRAAYGFMMTHPGKKLLFMGQDFAQCDEWNENESLQWDLLQYPVHSQMKEYVKELNRIYKEYPALYELDYSNEGFEWINCTYWEDNIVVFMRKTEKIEDTLVVVCNFAPASHDKFQIGVPFAGKYKEIFNSDEAKFGGSGTVNTELCQSCAEEWDERENSIIFTMAPMAVQIFKGVPYTKEELQEIAKKEVKIKEAKEARRKAEEAGHEESAKKNDALYKAEEAKKAKEHAEFAAKEAKRLAEEAEKAAEEAVKAEKLHEKAEKAAAQAQKIAEEEIKKVDLALKKLNK